MARWLGAIAAAFGGLGVAAGAYGAHGLAAVCDDAARIAGFQTGAEYHMYHAVVLVILAWMARSDGQSLLLWAAACFIVGIALFCGSLYLLALTKLAWLGPVTPCGGVALMLGWLLMGIAALRQSRARC